jgi:hypothetical protein
MSLIRKTSETTPYAGHTVNAYSESESNAYSCDYINDALDYSTDEVNTHKKWIDGKDIYRKVLSYSSSYTNTGSRTITHNLGIDTYTKEVYGHLKYSGLTFPVPRYANDGNNIGVSSISSNSLIIDVATAITSYSNLILELEYTKITDTVQSTRSLNTYSGDIEEKKNIVIDDGNK